MCGRRKIEKDYPHLADWGDMDWDLFKDIAEQLPTGIVIQLHNNGEPLLYPKLGTALAILDRNITQFNTNGKLLLEKADEIIDNLDKLTISVIQDDPEADQQYEIVRRFVERRKGKRPFIVYRLLGHVENPWRWAQLPGILITRSLHSADGSFDYEKQPTIPEIGICWDLLSHLAIDRYGWASICVRFDPEGHGRIANLNNVSLEDAWNHKLRTNTINMHKADMRYMHPLCAKCHYWGVPRGGD